MDKVMKAEIEDLLLKKYLWTELVTKELTNELTALIIKWLEGKREPYKYGCNQLLTELIGELR